MITMKEIARRVGVSRQAVSAVFNDSSNCRVSPATRERILAVARELNYVSNSAARSLKGAATKTIGIIGSLSDFGVIASLNTEITKMLLQRGYNLLYNECDLRKHGEIDGLLQLMARGVDGIIFIYNYDLEKVRQVKQTVPYVFLGDSGRADQDSDLKVDMEYGGYLATRHLLEHGHRKVALMVTLPQQREHLRCAGWRRAHQEAGITVDDDDVLVLRQYGGQVDAMLAELKCREVTAVLAFNDYIGAKLIKVLTQHGIQVPQDIAVVGTDGRSFVDYVSPSLATILNPVRPRAEKAVKLLMERIERKELYSAPAGHLIKPRFYPGESCGCVARPIDRMFRLNAFGLIEKDAMMNFGVDVFVDSGEEA
jgi:DNA-binding LacI/PurR family transcriptional regulator